MGGRGGAGSRNSAPDEFSGALGNRTFVSDQYKAIAELIKGQPSQYNKNLIKSIVNPEYDMFRSNKYSKNCALCTLASALRLKGYDVEAMPRDKDWRGPANVFDVDYSNKNNYILGSDQDRKYTGEPSKMVMRDSQGNKLKGLQLYHKNQYIKDIPVMPKSASAAAKAINDKVKTWGNGAFGEMSVTWKGGKSAHSVLIFNENGKATIYDSQTHKVHRDVEKYLSGTMPRRTSIQRLDNAPVKSGIKDLDKMVKRRKTK